jgi:hypothetical protein
MSASGRAADAAAGGGASEEESGSGASSPRGSDAASSPPGSPAASSSSSEGPGAAPPAAPAPPPPAAALAAELARASLAAERAAAAPSLVATKHLFVFSSAGKPIFSAAGSEESAAEAMAAARAIMAVAAAAGQPLRHVAGPAGAAFAFLDRPPLGLVAASTLGEPPAVLRAQLALAHAQIVSVLTASALAATFRRAPGFDARRLLGGAADAALRALAASFLASPAAAFGAPRALPLPAAARAVAAAALRAAALAGGALFGLLAAGDAVVAAAVADGRATGALDPWDTLLLLNMLASNRGLRLGEALAPVCLPRYNPDVLLHAYVHFLDPGEPGVALILLAGGAAPDVGALSAARAGLEAALGGGSGALAAAAAAARGADGASSPLAPARLPPAALAAPTEAAAGPLLLHWAYRDAASHQFVMAPFAGPAFDDDAPAAAAGSVGGADEGLVCGAALRRRVVVAYGQLRAGAFERARARSGAGPLQRARFEARPGLALAMAADADGELFAAFAPGAGRAAALAALGRLRAWARGRRADLVGAPEPAPFLADLFGAR